MRVEERYLDVLQNIEFMIRVTYRKHPSLTDYGVMRAFEALIDAYSAENVGRPPRDFRLSDIERELFEAMRMACDWRLGRGKPPVGPDQPAPPPLEVDEIIVCLKRLVRSAKMWNKEGGRQGYLDFITEYAM